jgi:hypothetical protein
MNKDEAMLELERLNREYPVDSHARKMRPLVFGDTTPPAAQPAPCTWTKSNDPSMPDTFDATCGVVWTFTDGGPAENDVRFCPGCGGKVVEGQP